MTKWVWVVGAVVALGVALWLALPMPTQAPVVGPSVEEYVRDNISALSPEHEVLGGKFYVTEISVGEDGTGAVSYEDGHIALVADFTWARSATGTLTITSFVVRK